MHPFDSKKMIRWALVCLYSSIICFGQFLHFLPAQLGVSLCSHPNCSSSVYCTTPNCCQSQTGTCDHRDQENETSCPYGHARPKGRDSNSEQSRDTSYRNPRLVAIDPTRNAATPIRSVPEATSNDECALCRILATMASFVITNDFECHDCCNVDRITAKGSPVILSIVIDPLSRGPPLRI